MFADPINPTRSELETWAYDADSSEPIEDFDLILDSLGYDDLFLRFAADPQCPKRRYFLSLLYLVVGDAVRTNYESRSYRSVSDLINEGEGSGDSLLSLWASRSRKLMNDPSTFSYAAWCGGDLAGDSRV